MATQTSTLARPADAIIAILGDVTEDNDRLAVVEVRPSMTEGEHLGVAVRMWGNGHWCTANGHPHFFTSREPALEQATLWIAEGRMN